MERQKPTTDLKHNDDFSKALIESYGRWMGGGGFGHHMLEEGIPAEMKQGPESPTREGGADASTSIPDLSGKEEKSDEGPKDISANAGAPDPATDLRVGAGVKQSHGAEIRDTTKVVAKEECCTYCGGKGCSKCQTEDKKTMKKEETITEKKGLYANIHAKRKRGEAPAKPGDEDYPAKDAFKKAAKTAKKEEVDLEEGDGLYANIHAKRKRGERMRSKGDKGAPTAQDFKDAAKTAKKEEVTTEGSMKQARKNVGASTCWDGYKAKGTKTKNGRQVPNCVKEDEVEEGYGAKKAKKMKKENTFSNWRQEIAEKK